MKGLGSRVWGERVRVEGSGERVRVQGLECRVQGVHRRVVRGHEARGRLVLDAVEHRATALHHPPHEPRTIPGLGEAPWVRGLGFGSVVGKYRFGSDCRAFGTLCGRAPSHALPSSAAPATRDTCKVFLA